MHLPALSLRAGREEKGRGGGGGLREGGQLLKLEFREWDRHRITAIKYFLDNSS